MRAAHRPQTQHEASGAACVCGTHVQAGQAKVRPRCPGELRQLEAGMSAQRPHADLRK